MPRDSNSKKPAAVILGLSLTSLGVIRSLGRKGIPVIGVDYEKRQIGSYSRYCEVANCPNTDRSYEDLLIFMKDLKEKFKGDMVLIPTSDEFVLFVSRNRDVLNQNYRFILPSYEMIEILNDKRKFYRIAEKNNMPVPKTFLPESLEDVVGISKMIDYPCVIKPAFGYLYKQFLFKATMAENPIELIEYGKKFHNFSDRILIQEFVSGKDDGQYSFATYFGKNCNPLVKFTSRKLRQNPPVFGTGTFVTDCVEPKIEKIGTSFLKALNYRGIAELEFKKDSRSGDFTMIEMNTRVWTQNNLAMRCGIDIAYIVYRDAIGQTVDGSSQTVQNIRWISFYDDFFACFGSSGYFKKREITPILWVKSLMCRKEYAIFAIDDIKPFVYATKTFVIKFLSKLLLKVASFQSGTPGAKNK